LTLVSDEIARAMQTTCSICTKSCYFVPVLAPSRFTLCAMLRLPCEHDLSNPQNSASSQAP